LARCAALSVLIGLALTTGVQPASASYSDLRANLWAYTDSHDPKTSFVKQDGDVPLGTRIDANHEAHTSRFYFSIDITSLRGTQVHMANLAASEASVVDCSTTSTTELWRTTDITDQTSWSKPPTELEQLGTASTFHTWQCPYAIGYDVLTAVNAALARHDPKITFELRLAKSDEPDPTKARTFGNRPGLFLRTNVAPTVSNPTTTGPGGGCGGLSNPTPAGASTELSAYGADADHSSYISGEFAIWPVQHPDQRTVVASGGYGDGSFRRYVDLSGYADGSVVAWAARAYDQEDYSAWTKPCFLRIDRTPPKTAPVVISKTYLRSTVVQSGGEGVPGDFQFDANGDRDVAAFRYSFSFGTYGTVAANHPGGTATITYTPTIAGTQTLTVVPLDAAGNAGPQADYQFYVGWTAPDVSLDLGGVGLPSHLTLTSWVDGTTDFSYQVEDSKEVRFPAVNGSGSVDLTFTHTGYTPVVVRSYNHSTLLGAQTYYAEVSDAPEVTSTIPWAGSVILGDQNSFTFRPFTTGVVAYQYSFNYGNDWQRVDARPDGTAVLNWTADTPGWIDLYVSSIRADGSVSQESQYVFEVIDPHPTVYADGLQNWPRTDGVGVPLMVTFNSSMPNVTGFAYTLNGGAEQTVSGGAYAFTNVVPDRAGDNTIVAQAIYADGTRSPATTYTFQITNAPIVSWNGDTMMPGDVATFNVRPALTGVTGYRYAFDSVWPGDATQTAGASADGTLSLPWVINYPGYHTLEIASAGADGTLSDFRIFQFIASDPTVSVYGSYGPWAPAGGVGVPGFISFTSWMASQVVQFVYQVNGGPELTVAMPPNSVSASVTITPDRSGTNTLTVRSLMTDGRYSPTTTYQFLVGTAPYVQSVEYPNSVWSGGAGVSGTFLFSGGTAGIVAFDYDISDGTSAEVATDAAGNAGIHWTPAAWGTFTMTVRGKLPDGTFTDQATYYIYVQP
jgi:hypothetical protein